MQMFLPLLWEKGKEKVSSQEETFGYEKSGVVPDLLQGRCQLVGAGSALAAAGDAFQAGDDFVYSHTLYQGADALQVAVAAADVLDVLQLAVFDVKKDIAGAGAFGGVFVMHS